MRLWHKLAIAGLLLLLSMLLLVYVAASQLLAATVNQQIQARGDELARPLSSALLAPLLQQDFATVQAVLDDVADAGHVKSLQLLDARGQAVAVSGGRPGAPRRPLGTAYVDRQGGLCMDFEVVLDASGQRLGTLRYALSAQALVDSAQALRKELLRIALAGLVLLGALVVLGSRRLTRPLQELSAAAGRMQLGQYDIALPPPGNDETGRLSASLAALRDAIQTRISQLHQAREVAESANQAKSSFLANTSHELRTPLNGVLGMARLAREPGLSPERRQHYLDLLADSANHLANILTDTLDLAKIEAGKFVLDRQPFDLRALLETTVASHRPLADTSGLVLGLQLDPAIPNMVLGDALRVRQILSNLLTNALKFTEHGSVQVVAQRLSHDTIRLAVADTGPGISAELRANLFSPFTQADSSTTRRHGGTGLGLAICRELAAQMAGDVGVDSTPGVGATFWARLALPECTAERSGSRGRSPNLGLTGVLALVVEDNPVNRLLVVSLLQSWNMRVDEAPDGLQAVNMVQQAVASNAPYDIIIMDLQMPVMDGYTATRQIRQSAKGADVPIIALTAAALTSEREAALREGMNDFLTKPLDPDRLASTISRLLDHDAHRSRADLRS